MGSANSEPRSTEGSLVFPMVMNQMHKKIKVKDFSVVVHHYTTSEPGVYV